MADFIQHRVIVADDNELVRKALGLFVSHLVHNMTVVGEASTGAEAVRLCHDRRPDLVLMDLKMPIMDGIEATRQILRENPTTKVIGLTSDAEFASLAAQALHAGAIACLSKQSTPGDIIDVLQRHGIPITQAR